MDLSTLHGPNYLVICAKARQEFLCAIQEAMNMVFSNPAERRYVTQNSASPHPISLSLSQTYISCFSSLGFQITILNSPTQFLSLTLSFPLAISLSFVSRSSVFMNGCNLWPCMYVDVNVYCYSCGYVAMYVCRWERV